MIERLGGKNFILDGDVRPIEDYYEGIDETDDGRVLDKIISGIDPRDIQPASHVQALAQGTLFLLSKDQSAGALRESIVQHPSAQNVPAERLGYVASDIIQAYQNEVARLEHYKKKVNLSAARRDLFVAVTRNREELDVHDLERIAELLGHDKNYFIDHKD
ncbi:MAG: hypothetical protein JWM07_891 [Candidatus Saccharibacteria bacterium]|nr:hypothetical protein [Candidatus Saccharibacteria bacterium]